jgi:hypothetical protein
VVKGIANITAKKVNVKIAELDYVNTVDGEISVENITLNIVNIINKKVDVKIARK